LKGFANIYGPVRKHVEDIVERHVLTIVQSLHFIAHVLEQKLILQEIYLQSSSKETKNEFYLLQKNKKFGRNKIIYRRNEHRFIFLCVSGSYPSHWNHAPLVNINHVPSILEIPNVCVTEESILFV
jgi:hypothetical protein